MSYRKAQQIDFLASVVLSFSFVIYVTRSDLSAFKTFVMFLYKAAITLY